MKCKRVYTFLCAATLLFIVSGCLTDDKLNLDFTSYEPKNIHDGIVISDPITENIDTQLLDEVYRDIYSDANFWSLRSLLVFRNGKLIAEAYPKDESDITNKHIIWSCTKQVMGILAGIAVDQELIEHINMPISRFITEIDQHPEKTDITIRNLLTMQSGIDYHNAEQTDEILRRIPDNSLEFILDRPMNSLPGDVFHYNDGNPHLLSILINRITNQTTDEFADEFLFSKIGVKNYNWIRYKDGTTLGGFGIETTPRELSKIALCVADSGRWQGMQIISPEWISDMTSVQAEIEGYDYSFGYFWWIDELRKIYFMWGAGGQFAFIVPDKQLVIIMTSFPSTKGEYEIEDYEALSIVDRIIDATY